MRALIGLQRGGESAADGDEMCRLEKLWENIGLQRRMGAAAELKA